MHLTTKRIIISPPPPYIPCKSSSYLYYLRKYLNHIPLIKGMLTAFVLALTVLTAMPATAQTSPTVDITATNNNGDRDSMWDGLQVDEGDTVTMRITPSTTLTSGAIRLC